jgi:ubiquitin C-terminal hydrolase
MDENEKKLLESLKNFDISKLFMPNTYVDFEFKDLFPSYITSIEPGDKYSIYIPNKNSNLYAPKNMLRFYGENDHFENNKLKNSLINIDLYHTEPTDVITFINQKLKSLNIILPDEINESENDLKKKDDPAFSSNETANKHLINDENGNSYDIKGYLTYQFLEGILNDCLFITRYKLLNNHSLNFTEKELLSLVVDIILYCANIVKSNLKYYKTAYYNRKLLIVSQIHAILVSFDSLISNLSPFYKYISSTYVDLSNKLSKVINLVYQIVISSKNTNSIPLQSLIIFIKLITFQMSKGTIDKFNKDEIYLILKDHMKNLDKNELIFFKSDSSIKEICNGLINDLFNYNIDSYMNEIYFSYLFSCLKCDNLEKKINALNDINDIINHDYSKSNKINQDFKEFIDKNNILEMFFDDNTHEEIIKRSCDLFKYLAKFNCLKDNIIEKLIEKQKSNKLMKDILMEIVSELPLEKKNELFKRLSKGIQLGDNSSDNIEFISKLTISCFNSTKMKDSLNVDDKEDEKEKEEKFMEEESENNYYGLSMIFDYILYNFDETKNYKENNIDKAINLFENTIVEIGSNTLFGIDDIELFIDKLFENIKSNEKHNSIIQSIKLIPKLLSVIENDFDEELEDILKGLNQKYDIITLLIDDLIRYLNISENKFSEFEIYEGIYPHSINISERLNLIFYFIKRNYEFMLQGKKHLEKIYQILKPEKFKEERKKFYEIMTKSTGKLDNSLLTEFYKDILQNNEEFDLTQINDNETINLVIKIFKQINYNKASIIYDGRIIRVSEGSQIEGLDLLFNLLTKNSKDFIQEKVSGLLCAICLYHKNYSNELLPSFWIDFFNKIDIYLDEIIKTNDKITFNGIIKLIDKIYDECKHMEGKIMSKSDYKSPKSNFRDYHFYNMVTKKQSKLKAGFKDKFIELRYKISYFFDIPVNNVCLVDLNDDEYNLNNDFDNFISIFSDEKYFYKKGFECIKVRIEPFTLEKIKDNPIMLIEKNEKIYNILINNLNLDSTVDNTGALDKEKIWNIFKKLPKLFYFDNNLKKYGSNEKIEEQELSKFFNINNIYIFTYYLQCIYKFLKSDNIDNTIKEEYLSNFIDVHHIDKLIINNLFKISIDSDNCNIIKIDCVQSIINIIYKIEELKKNRTDLKEDKIIDKEGILQKLTDIISNLIKINTNEKDNIYMEEELDENLDDKITELGKKIFNFIKNISNEENAYMNFIFNNQEKFIIIFVKDFIKCQNSELKAVIEQNLSDNFQNNSDSFLIYLETVLNPELFEYLLKNDSSGNYFHVIASIINKYFEKKENKEFCSKTYPDLIMNLKKIIDLFLNYINQEDEKLIQKFKNENKNSNEIINNGLYINSEFFKEELFLFVSNIISLQPKELVNYIINKVDICDFFLMKCNLRKCNKNPLETPDSFCLNNDTKASIHKLILNIIRNSDDENQFKIFNKVIEILDNLNKTGFWKTYNVHNWDIEHNEMQKGKFVGLKNMTSTCYLNSIVQQLYMIPSLRETIIKIENPSTTNILYELQLLFSSLKIYENSYYDPRSFVIANNLNFAEQMDADEFYGTLIDKIEKDIKEIYSTKINDKSQENKKDNYKYKDLFNYFFGIRVLDELQFVDCRHKRYNEFCYYNIQVEIKNCNNLYESLNNYFKAEVMDGDNKINCEECNTKRICHKHLLLKSLPKILVICLKRFEFDYETMLKFKLNKYFEFPFQLNMKDYMIENHKEKNTEYDLTGIVVHNGVSDFGHYYDLIKGPDNKWYKFNDENVTEFNEEYIPNEAFGNKDIDDDDSEKEIRKKNAYILFYTKKSENDNEELKKYELALPPYNKESNIKKEIRETINLKLYKSWIIKNIFSTWYQNFVLGLFKTHMDKKTLSMIAKNNVYNYEEEKEENKEEIIKKDIYDVTEMDDKIFQFIIRYYFNVVCRISKRTEDKNIHNLREKFKGIINNWIQNDINKAKYFLEEFCNSQVIDEYLTYCPSKYDINYCTELIRISFLNIYQNTDTSNENCFLFQFMNTWLTYIAKNLSSINLENVCNILYKMINSDVSLTLNYMKEKGLLRWVIASFRKEKSDEVFDSIFNEENLPTVHPTHSILAEKTMDTEEKYEKLKDIKADDVKDILDFQFINNLGDLQSNNILLNELKKNL